MKPNTNHTNHAKSLESHYNAKSLLENLPPESLMKMCLLLRKEVDRLKEESLIDHLTRVPNRRYFMENANEFLRRAKRDGTAGVVGLVDIDHFKSVNDTYGHPVGDAALRLVAGAIRESVRPQDVVGRYGGEEFAFLLVGADREQAMHAAERVRASVAELSVEPVPAVHVSIGIADVRDFGYNLSSALTSADAALYRAKDGGRNRVEVAWLAADERRHWTARKDGDADQRKHA